MPHKSKSHCRRPLTRRSTFRRCKNGGDNIPQGYIDAGLRMRLMAKRLVAANARGKLLPIPVSLNRSKHLDGKVGRYNGHFISCRDKDL